MSAYAAVCVACSEKLVTDRPALSCFTECHCFANTVKHYVLRIEYYVLSLMH